MTKIIAICLILVLSACGPISPTLESEVDWSKYHPSVRQRINLMAGENDCRGLQRQFDTAYENSDTQRARTGTSNSLLMGYILGKLESSRCYASRRPK